MARHFTYFTAHISATKLMLIAGLFISPLVMAQSKADAAVNITDKVQHNSIATVVPVVHSLLSQLLANTPINIHYLAPKRLPINRLSHWVAKNASKKQQSVSAVVGIDAIRPALSFYSALRKENIHTVNIDIANALMPGGEQVAIYQQNQQGYFWLNLNNALLMTGILRRDLTALWPALATQINSNAASISQQLRQLSMQLDDALFDNEIEQLVVAQPALADFAASFPLPLVTLEQASANGLKSLFIQKLKSKTPALSQNISLWAIDDFSKTSTFSFSKRWLITSKNIK